MIDVQKENEERGVDIEEVGVTSFSLPLLVSDKLKESQHVTANVEMSVKLPKSQRGTHMSRFIGIIQKYQNTHFDNKCITKILGDILNDLDASSAKIEVGFIYFVEKKAPVSGHIGIMGYKCKVISKVKDGQKPETFIEIKVPISSVCPCSLAISDIGAHNQRGEVTVIVRADKFIWFEDLITLVEKNASGEVYSLLKREDEKEVTEKMFGNPKFVEDIVRDIFLRLRKDKRLEFFSVKCENFESIHNHNAYAKATCNESN